MEKNYGFNGDKLLAQDFLDDDEFENWLKEFLVVLSSNANYFCRGKSASSLILQNGCYIRNRQV